MYRVAALARGAPHAAHPRHAHSIVRTGASSFARLQSIWTVAESASSTMTTTATRPAGQSLTMAPLRAQPVPRLRTQAVTKRRTYSTETPIEAEEEPLKYGLLYFDNAYPLKMGWWDVRYSLMRPGWKSLERKAKNELVPPENAMPFHFKIGGIEPRLKDGGMFVHFSYVHPKSYTTREALKEIESRCEQHLISHDHYMWFNFQKVRAFMVKGTPFLEDMASRYPNSKIRVEYTGNASVESLYNTFRKYGRIVDVVQVPLVKDMPRQVIVQYSVMRAATSAKNCLHSAEIEGVRLSVTYERTLQGNVIWTWLQNHPRITVPLGGMLIAGMSFAVFDPMRVFSMNAKITQLFNVNEYPILRWLRKETIGRLTRTPIDVQSGGLRERENDEELLRNWLRVPPETFAIVLGPRGSGKTEMVEYVIKEKKHKVVIKCEELANARSEGELLSNLARQIGYIPLFQFMATINNMMDVAITATTGQKAGLSATFEGQLKKILDTLTAAIQQASPTRDMTNTSPDAIMKKIEMTVEEKLRRAEQALTGECEPILRGESKRKSRKRREAEESKWCDPDDIPIIVIDGYMTRDKGPLAKELWTHLADWAAVLVENHVAHVVFITNNVAASKPLAKALPNMTFETLVLADAPLESSLEYVYKHLDREEYPDLIEPVQTIGGRLTDLELFVQKIKGGLTSDEAMHDILTRAVVEVRKNAYDFDNSDGRTLSWTPIQFWTVMKALANTDAVSFDELKIHSLFKNDEAPFSAMEQAELISIVHKNGRPFALRPGKPIYRSAFQEILLDTGFSSVMDLESANYLEKEEMAKVAKYEAELRDLSNLLHTDGSWYFGGGRVPKEVDTRVKWLMKKLAESHAKVEKYEQQANEAKKAIANLSQAF